MPKKEKQRSTTNEEILDSYEAWLEVQPVKHTKARPGFSADEETEEG